VANGKGPRSGKAIGYSALGALGTKGASFVLFIVLARLLTPQEFGLMAMAAVVVAVGQIFSDLGFSEYLIKYDRGDRIVELTAFWTAFSSAILSLGIVFLSAPHVAAFFEEPAVTEILRVASLTFVIGVITVVPRAILSRNFRFDLLAKADITSVLLGGVCAVALAAYGAGVWSLVVQAIVSISTRALLYSIFSGWWPSVGFRAGALKEIWDFSGYLLGTKGLNYLVQNFDNILVGKLLGSVALGLYGRTYQLISLPSQFLAQTVNKVFFVRYVELGDKEAVKRRYLKISRMVLLLLGPIMVLLSIAAQPIVAILFGSKWLGMAPLLSVMAIVGLLQGLGVLRGSIFLSQGATKTQFFLGLIVKTATLVAVAIGAKYGLVAVAWAVLISGLVTTWIALHVAGSLIDLTVTEYLIAQGDILLALAIAAGVGFAATMGFDLGESEWFRAVVATLAVGTTLVVVLWALGRRGVEEAVLAKRMVIGFWKSE
jgi:O-antigen/teichoic acid export membrane protein